MKPLARTVAAVVAVAVIATACGGEPEIYEVPPSGAAAFRQLTLPQPVPAVASFVAYRNGGFNQAQIESFEVVPGVAVAAPVALARMWVKGPGGAKRLRVGAVDPGSFRSVAPPPTRQADFVWLALIAGDAVLTQEAAKKIGFKNTELIRVKGIGPYHVGALADNGSPNLVDVMVDGEQLGIPLLAKADAVVVGAESGATLQGIADGLRRSVEGVRLKRLLPRTQSVAPEQQSFSGGTLPLAGGLHPTLAASVQRLIAASNGRIWIVSGFRSYAHQYQLWVNALRKYGNAEAADNWVAPPGSSMHERGLAVDLGGDLDLAVRLIRELRLPLWRPMSWEPWHFELYGSRG